MMIRLAPVKLYPAIQPSNEELELLSAELTRDTLLEYLSGCGPHQQNSPEDIGTHWAVRLATKKYSPPTNYVVETIILASLIQCSPPGLKSILYDYFPRAAPRADTYSGETLSPADIGSSLVTENTYFVLAEEYCSAPEARVTNILEHIRGFHKVIFGLVAHRALAVRSSRKKVDSRVVSIISRVRAKAIANSDIETLAAIELVGYNWTAGDEISAKFLSPTVARPMIRYWRLRARYRDIPASILVNNNSDGIVVANEP